MVEMTIIFASGANRLDTKINGSALLLKLNTNLRSSLLKEKNEFGVFVYQERQNLLQGQMRKHLFSIYLIF